MRKPCLKLGCAEAGGDDSARRISQADRVGAGRSVPIVGAEAAAVINDSDEPPGIGSASAHGGTAGIGILHAALETIPQKTACRARRLAAASIVGRCVSRGVGI